VGFLLATNLKPLRKNETADESGYTFSRIYFSLQNGAVFFLRTAPLFAFLSISLKSKKT